MGIEKKIERLDRKIERFKQLKFNSLRNILEKTWDLFYIVNIGGTLIRRYQRPRAEQLGWEEKKLTIVNAMLCGIIPALGYSAVNYFFGDNVSESFQTKFYFYPGFMFTAGLLRIGYAMATRKAIGAVSIYNAIGTSVYAIEEIMNFLKKDKKSKYEKACGGS